MLVERARITTTNMRTGNGQRGGGDVDHLQLNKNYMLTWVECITRLKTMFLGYVCLRVCLCLCVCAELRGYGIWSKRWATFAAGITHSNLNSKSHILGVLVSADLNQLNGHSHSPAFHICGTIFAAPQFVFIHPAWPAAHHCLEHKSSSPCAARVCVWFVAFIFLFVSNHFRV